MADNVLISAPTRGVPVATDAVTTINGVTQDPTATPQAQRVKAGWGTDGQFFDATPATPHPMADFSGPDVWLNNGVAVVTKAGVLAVPARPGRTSLLMEHAGDQSGVWTLAQRVWLGYGAMPLAGSLPTGTWLDPGMVFDKRVPDTLAMYLVLDPSAADGSSQIVTFTEFAG